MAKHESKKPASNIPGGISPDPYLRAFLRQAVAIIASERGINDAGYAKLQVVAERLGLSDETFEAAVERLKLPHSMLGLNRYEKRFVELLSNEFEEIRGDVLSIKAEDRIVELAENRYQIDSIRAYQLIRKTAEHFDVATISHSDAQQFALHLIDEAVSSNTWLRENDRQRLYHACVKWGLSDSAVDTAIRARLARNRWMRRKRLFYRWVSAVILFVIAGTMLWAGTQLDWHRLAGYLSDAPTSVPKTEVDSGASIPAWWNDEFLAIADRLQQRNGHIAPLISEIGISDTEGRRSIYEQMTGQLLDASEWNPLLGELMAQLYLQDPVDKAVSTIIRQMEVLLLVSKSETVATPGQIRRSLAANRLLAAMFELVRKPAAAPNRRLKVNELVERTFGLQQLTGSNSEFVRQTGLRLTVDQWNHAARHCRTNPQQVAAFLPELEKRLPGRDDQGINELRTHVLLTILEDQPHQWRTLQPSIVTAIENADAPKAVSWIDLLAKTTERSLSEFLTNQLAAQLNLKPDSQSRETMLSELRKFRTEFKHRSSSAAIDGSRKISDRIQRFEEQLNNTGIGGHNPEISAMDQKHLPRLIIEAAQINNLAFAWIQSVKAKDDFSRLDEMELISPALLTELDRQGQPIAKPIATFSENRTFQGNLDRIFNSDPAQITARISALQSLAKLAGKVDDISYSTAAKLVSWLFEEKEMREQLAVERALPQFSHWTRLPLAIADGLDRPELDLDAVLSHLNRLGIQNLSVDRGADWRDGLRKEILLAVAGRNANAEDEANNRAGWNQLETILSRQYAERMELVRGKGSLGTRSSLSDMLSNGIGDSISDLQEPGTKRWLRSLELIRSTDAVEMSKLVLSNQVLAEIYGSRIPGSQSTGLASTKYTSALQGDSLNNGQRLLASELMLMEVLAEFRKRWIERVTE